ncbi:LysR family transcriptional regulator [Chelonobacter oris]|uniref:LysR family transcriptional regulator n=1 Tax=Chelonobacter oris TaxID=505317 RepID=A0A0A3AVN1_9PAST|nr:LysR family transcriptional regulator [Chelonobacter oris]KGQ71120.1 LysR family transcriptional regulator [Chelonobacter oris]
MKENLNDLRTFLLVAREGSFTKAAAQLGVSQSALSHAMRAMEVRLGVKLLVRTTRSVSTTDAGEQLRQRLAPLFDNIDEEIQALGDFRGGVRGNLRIEGTDLSFSLLWEKFADFMRNNAEVSLEFGSHIGFSDIVAKRFDVGIRLGDDVAKDMIAVRVAPDLQMCVVAGADYLAKCGTPTTPYDLSEHNCLALRLPTHGGLLAWEFVDQKNGGKPLVIHPQGNMISNTNELLKKAAGDQFGLMWAPRYSVENEVRSGALISVLDDWAISYQGMHLYYPHRRADSPLFRALVDALRWRGSA